MKLIIPKKYLWLFMVPSIKKVKQSLQNTTAVSQKYIVLVKVLQRNKINRMYRERQRQKDRFLGIGSWRCGDLPSLKSAGQAVMLEIQGRGNTIVQVQRERPVWIPSSGKISLFLLRPSTEGSGPPTLWSIICFTWSKRI